MLNWNEMEENKIIEIAKGGNDEAKMLIINRYKPLIYRFLSQYYSRFASTSSELKDDLISDGIYTILECINTYDETKASFSTHCYYQLRATIQNNLRYTYKGIQHGLTSMDKAMNEGSEDKEQSMHDVIPDNNVDIEKDYIENEEKERIWNIAKKVATDKEWKAFKLMATDGLTRKEMATQLGCTESALCRQRDKLIKKIQRYL